MIDFFRDTLDGPIYIVVAILSLIFIMAIIGFMMERSKLAKEEKSRVVYVNNKIDTPNVDTEQPVAQPVSDVPILEQTNNNVNEEIPQQPVDNNPSLLVKTPVVVFSDPDKKE